MFDKEYFFYGKHADMVKRLTSKLDDEIGKSFFNTNADIYLIAPLIGYIYNRKAEVPQDKRESTKVYITKMIDYKDDMLFNYRNIMLMLYKDDPDKNAVDIAFRMDEKEEERAEYDRIYDAYVLGGLEELYERIFGEGGSTDEYIMNYYEFLQDLNVRWYGASVEEE